MSGTALSSRDPRRRAPDVRRRSAARSGSRRRRRRRRPRPSSSRPSARRAAASASWLPGARRARPPRRRPSRRPSRARSGRRSSRAWRPRARRARRARRAATTGVGSSSSARRAASPAPAAATIEPSGRARRSSSSRARARRAPHARPAARRRRSPRAGAGGARRRRRERGRRRWRDAARGDERTREAATWRRRMVRAPRERGVKPASAGAAPGGALLSCRRARGDRRGRLGAALDRPSRHQLPPHHRAARAPGRRPGRQVGDRGRRAGARTAELAALARAVRAGGRHRRARVRPPTTSPARRPPPRSACRWSRIRASGRRSSERFASFGRTPTPNNRKQAEVLEGATVLGNRRGTAPGQRVEAGGATLFLFPGVPHELEALLERELEPWLAARAGEMAIETGDAAGPRCAPNRRSIGRSRRPTRSSAATPITVLASPGEVKIRLTVSGAPAAARRTRLDAMRARVAGLLGDSVYAEGAEVALEATVGRLLAERGLTARDRRVLHRRHDRRAPDARTGQQRLVSRAASSPTPTRMKAPAARRARGGDRGARRGLGGGRPRHGRGSAPAPGRRPRGRASPASPAPAAAVRRSRWARSTWRSPVRTRRPRTAAPASRATASGCASSPRWPRSSWCGAGCSDCRWRSGRGEAARVRLFVAVAPPPERSTASRARSSAALPRCRGRGGCAGSISI